MSEVAGAVARAFHEDVPERTTASVSPGAGGPKSYSTGFAKRCVRTTTVGGRSRPAANG